MRFSDALDLPAPARYSLAAGFGLAVVLASMLRPPGTILAQPGPLGLFGWDKWVHFFSYAAFAVLAVYAIRSRAWLVLLAVLVLNVVAGAAVEGIQLTIPWRTGEAADVVANTAGAAVALAGWRVATRGRLGESGSATADSGSAAADAPATDGRPDLD